MTTTNSAIDATQIEADARRLAGSHPADIVAEALERFDNITISFSGAEDVVLVDFAAREAERLGRTFNVFTLDTGRLHPETLEFIQQVRDHYNVTIEAYYPQAEAVQALVREKGLFSFRADGHQECCGIRKVEPLGRALAHVDAYITGQRKDQSPGTRADIPVVQLDPGFGRQDEPLVKFNPLANWTSAPGLAAHHGLRRAVQTRSTTRASSRSVAPHAREPRIPASHERAGRWWWEEATQKECGLHSINLEQ